MSSTVAPATKITPVSPPPPGQTSNFENPVTLELTLDVVNGVLVGLTTLVAFFRLGAKWYGRPLGWDDWTFLLAYILSLARLNTVFNSEFPATDILLKILV